METKNKIIIALTILIVSALMTGCKKIPVPDPNAKVIFGEWKYVNSSGGFTGGQTAGGFDSDTWIEFKETGKYQVHNNWRRIYSEKFKFQTKRSIYTGNDEPTIVYDKKTSQTFRVSGDTLFLFDQAYDAFGYTFVKK